MSQNGEIDWEKVEEFQERADAYDELLKKKARLFDPKELLKKTEKIRKVEDPDFGIICYGPILSDDLTEINKEKTNEEKGLVMLWIALRKAYPELTLEDVKAFELKDYTKLMKAIFGDAVNFFPTQKQSPSGLKTPTTFKGSDS
jgi:hypothetical protein